MKLKAPFWLLACLPLLVGGCLLPQPDTPPIGPQSAPARSNAGGAAPANTVMPQEGAATRASAAPVADTSATPAASATPTAKPTSSPSASPSSDAGASGTASPKPAASATASPKPGILP